MYTNIFYPFVMLPAPRRYDSINTGAGPGR